jgi:hypothetical protein
LSRDELIEVNAMAVPRLKNAGFASLVVFDVENDVEYPYEYF